MIRTLILFTLKVHPLPSLAAIWRQNKLDASALLALFTARAQQHGKRFDSAHGDGFQVAHDNDGRTPDLVLGHVLDQARADGTRLIFADVDGFDVERVGFGVLFDYIT